MVVCDICKKNPPTNRIKYKAERYDGCEFLSIGGVVRAWRRIELCDECLNKIITATTETCSSCRYWNKKGSEEPCKYCNKHSLWTSE